MLFGNLKRRLSDLEDETKELRQMIRCLRGLHDWVVAQGMVIRCKHCRTKAETMPDANNTQPKAPEHG